MPDAYNPILRTFCQIRAVLLNDCGIARNEVRPESPLDAMLPLDDRRKAWGQLRARGFGLPGLVLTKQDHHRNLWAVLRTTVSFTLHLQRWYGLLIALPVTCVVYWVHRHRAVHFPLELKTVGELVIYATRFNEHKDSGYRWTKNEISMKVRMIIAESTGQPLEAVQPESKLLELCAD
jgi:hypothetical protein